MRGESVIVQPVFFSLLLEGEVALVDPELVGEAHPFLVAGIADIDIQQPVRVDVCHHHTGAPFSLLPEPCLLRYVFKPEISFVEEQLVGSHIGREEYVHQTVIIDVAGGHTGTVVEIPVAENVEVPGIADGIGETYPGVRHFREELCRLPLLAGGEQCQEQEDVNGSEHV